MSEITSEVSLANEVAGNTVSSAQAKDINSIGQDLAVDMMASLQQAPFDEMLIREYLLDNPDFFNRYPELLVAMRVPHAERGAVSLVDL